jgi:hypothetical protein
VQGRRNLSFFSIDQYNALIEGLHAMEMEAKRKLKNEKVLQEMKSWSDLSVKSAMAGMEDENEPDYSLEDVKERSS